MTALLYLIQIYRVVDRCKGSGVSPRGVLPLDCLQKRGSGFYRFIGFRGGGAAQKIMKRRRVLIALRAVVISSLAERSSLQNGQHTNCATSITACF